MKAMLTAFAAIALIAVGSDQILNSIGYTGDGQSVSSSVRLGN